MNTESQGLSPLRILLAEDDRSVAFSIAFALKIDGHKVQIVAEGGQALASVRTEPDRFDLLITDHSMPGMTGVELIQQFREKSFCGKVMVLSAHLSAEVRTAYEALAVDAMVSKPFDVHQLRALIWQIVKGGGPPLPGRSDPIQLSRTELCNLFKLALSDEDEPEGEGDRE